MNAVTNAVTRAGKIVAHQLRFLYLSNKGCRSRTEAVMLYSEKAICDSLLTSSASALKRLKR